MGPKRRHEEASSSSRTYDKKKFISAEAADKFDNVMAGRPLILERGLRPDEQDGDMMAMIRERGWEKFTEHPDAACTAIVKEFYANALDTPDCEVMVRGKLVSFSREAINNYYNLRCYALCQYAHLKPDYDRIVQELCQPGTEWKRNALNGRVKSFPGKRLSRYGKIWYAFLCAKMMPCTHVGDVTWERAGLLYAIITNLKIDVGGVIAASIRKKLQGGTSSGLPHPSLITELCRQAGVKWGAAELLQPPTTLLDHHLIQRYQVWPGGQSHARGLGFILAQQPQAAPAPAMPAGPSHSPEISLRDINDQLQRMQRRQERDSHRMDRQNQRLAVRQGELYLYNVKVNEAWRSYFSHQNPASDMSHFPVPQGLSEYPPSEDNDEEESNSEDANDDTESDQDD